MTPDTRAWLDGLRAFAAAEREHKPPTHVVADVAARGAEREILAADLSARLATLDELRAARRAVASGDGGELDADPAFVVTTSSVGIGVVAELLAAPRHGLQALAAVVAAVTEREYRLWCIREPDERHRLHVNLWSWVKTSVPARRWPEFARHPLGPGEMYWLHRAGTAGAGGLDARHCHLWTWNGRQAVLAEAFVREQTVGRLAAHGDHGSGENDGRN